MNNKSVRNQLTYPQAYALQKWLEAEMKTMTLLTHQQIAQMAVGKLGFAVTESNIKGAEKVLQCVIGTRENRRLPATSQANVSEQDIRTLAYGLCNLYTATNTPMNFALAELVSRLENAPRQAS